MENYVKAIYALQRHAGRARVQQRAGRAARGHPCLRVGHGEEVGRAGVGQARPLPGRRLTATASLALEVLRHHRLLELYLAESLGVPWDRVHDEAEVLEHALSEELEELIADQARTSDGRPARRSDPHARRAMPESDTGRLEVAGARPGGHFRPRLGLRPAMLRYLADRGISPGDPFRSWTSSRSTVRCSLRFDDDVHVMGGGPRPGHARRAGAVSRRRVLGTERLHAPRREVWARVTTHGGRQPRAGARDAHDLPAPMLDSLDARRRRALGGRSVRCWISSRACIPFDYDELMLVELGPGLRFLERSPMGSMRPVEHERTCVDPAATAARSPTGSPSSRGSPALGGPLRPVCERFFAHRHRRLRRRFGRPGGGAA